MNRKSLIKFFTLAAICCFALLSIGCASVMKQNGYGNKKVSLPDAAKADPAVVPTPAANPDPWVKEMLKNQAQTNNLLGKLIVTMKNGNKAESTGTPGPYARRANGKTTDTKKAATVKKTPTKTKVVYSGVSRKEFNQLKNKVAEHDNRWRLTNPEIENGKVEFSRGSSTLGEDDKKYLKDLAERWFAGMLDISMIIGNADPTKPKLRSMSNLDYARNRLNEVTKFLGAEGVDLSDTRTFIDETNMYSNSCNTSFVNKKISRPEEIAKRKQARAALRKMPLTNGMTLKENAAAMNAKPMAKKTKTPAPAATTVAPKKKATPAPTATTVAPKKKATPAPTATTVAPKKKATPAPTATTVAP